MPETQAAAEPTATKAASDADKTQFKVLRADLVATIRDKGGNETYSDYIIFDHPETDEKLRKASSEDIKKKKIIENDQVFLYDPETDQQVRAVIEKRPDGKHGLSARCFWGTLCAVSVNITKEDINKDLNK